MFCRRLVVAVVAVPLLAPAAAVARSPLPLPAIAQYVEEVPTAGGPAVPTTAKPRVTKLPPRIEHRIAAKGGRETSAIEAIATSSVYGAPQTTLGGSSAASTATGPATAPQPAAKHKPPPPHAAPAKPGPTVRVPAAATYATDGSSGDRLPLL